jgi:hypothetical protein
MIQDYPSKGNQMQDFTTEEMAVLRKKVVDNLSNLTRLRDRNIELLRINADQHDSRIAVLKAILAKMP